MSLEAKLQILADVDNCFKITYILCEIVYPGCQNAAEVTSLQVYMAVKNSILEAHGDLGLGRLQFSLSVKYVNTNTNIIIIRGERRFFDILLTSIIFIKSIGSSAAFLNTLHVGGSIRSCQKFVIQYHRANMPKLFPLCKSEEERKTVMQSIVDACEDLESMGYKPSRGATSAPSALDLLHRMEDDG